MPKVIITVEYKGTRYSGWQTQNVRTQASSRRRLPAVQETIEFCLKQVLQEQVNLIGSGRTDAGVHAFNQAAHFTVSKAIQPLKLRLALNALLPEDIVVKRVAICENQDFHSRFHAKGKIYRYLIFNRVYPDVFCRDYAYYLPQALDIQAMRSAAKALVGRHDFKSFCASGSKVKNTVRVIRRLIIKRTAYNLQPGDGYERGKPLVIITIEGNGFLYNMVRVIVGTLLEIGRGRLEPRAVVEILRSRDRRQAGPTAPAKGLCLMRVRY